MEAATDLSRLKEVHRAIQHPDAILAELCRRSFKRFMEEFWDYVSNDPLQWNWHLDVLCEELTKVAVLVGNRIPKRYDLIINIPPGTTKSKCVNVMFPAWCWTKWSWMQFISASYTDPLALEQANLSKDIIDSDKFKRLFPHLIIRNDKNAKGNFKLISRSVDSHGNTKIEGGGNRFSTSVGGTVTGFHGHINIVDDPLDPRRAASDAEIKSANGWMDSTLPMRKTDKRVTVTILIMQRLAQDDCTGHWLEKKKKNVRHLCLPGEIRNYRKQVKPKALIDRYEDDLLDPVRMPWSVLDEMLADLGQYGYAGQVGQSPSPPSGGMFKVDRLIPIQSMPTDAATVRSIRYWDKASTQDGGTYTAGVKMHLLQNGKYLISDVIRGQWSSEIREKMIKSTAEADGVKITVYVEQEPGSGGKDSADGTIKNLAGYSVYRDLPKGKKWKRGDTLSVQVNLGNVQILVCDWNHDFKEEGRFWPFSTFLDQWDAASGAFSRLTRKKTAKGRH